MESGKTMLKISNNILNTNLFSILQNIKVMMVQERICAFIVRKKTRFIDVLQKILNSEAHF
jgi:hypothetical protein